VVRLPFADRGEAGRLLGLRLAELLRGEPVVVLGLPRGGVVVAAAVAAELDAPLDAFGVRKLPLPGRPELAGRTAVLVDDGVATGATARAALRAVRALGPARTILAAPVVPVRLDLSPEADSLVALATPHPFGAVSGHYVDFRETTDEEVRRALAR